jgi:hypothetical protein
LHVFLVDLVNLAIFRLDGLVLAAGLSQRTARRKKKGADQENHFQLYGHDVAPWISPAFSPGESWQKIKISVNYPPEK